MTPNISKTKKPPLTTNKVATTSVTKVPSRAQSVDTSNPLNVASTTGGPSAFGGDQGDIYQAIEEPLLNPEKQFQQAVDMLKSGDWQKQFEACNIVKRVAMFHKNLMVSSNPVQGQIFKELIKLVDSLRS